MDVGYLVQTVDEWKRLLPRVHPFYAIKANPDPVLLHLMKEMNFGFDCASMYEIKTIIDMGVHPSKVVYANTRKQSSHAKYASSVGVDLTTFDDEDELQKIETIAPNMKLLLRISTEGFARSQSEGMAKKFGCSIKNARSLLKKAQLAGLKVQGVSFHVGSGVTSPEAFSRAMREAKMAFVEGSKLGFHMNILDIGGGFPCETATKYCTIKFSKVAEVINKALDEEFHPNEHNDISIIAEPGIYFSMPSTVLVANIIEKRVNGKKCKAAPNIEYFINDGNQSSLFTYKITNGVTPVAMPVAQKHIDAPVFKCKVWGQTCDDDVVLEECELPDMDVGDWIYFTESGWRNLPQEALSKNGLHLTVPFT
ncbi:Ornithine decarboxylase [Holothuria leucospilota]|uniref:Ornithine decarboxylase n=1 Tax=Holothuria leucospilota TaxID=206669 RepID=A0A9Q0YIL5_HOLLE|nr:Ornithine decarboxylase [Holothuria leucospilota]